MNLLVSIPCLNEAATLAGVIQRIPREIEGFGRVDVLVVDDGSADESAAVARAAGAHVLSHGANRGVGASFQTALDHAVTGRYDVLVTVDADGQFAPEDIPRLTAPIVADEADFVTASRFVDPARAPSMPSIKRWGNARMAGLVSRLTGQTFYDVSCGFRAYGREAMLNLNLHGDFTYTQETFLQLSFKRLRLREVPVDVTYFDGRVSRVANSIPRYAVKTLAIILTVYRDYRPIRFFWWLAAGFTLSGCGVASIMLVHYLRTGRFYGQLWSGLTGGFLVMVGLVLFVVGVVADLLDRVRRNQERMLYHMKRDGPPPRG